MDPFKELAAEYERETASTRKVLAAIPSNADLAYKPHEKSMALGRLAAHVSDTAGDWAIHTLTRDGLNWTPEMRTTDPTSTSALLERFDAQVAETKAALAALPASGWDGNWKMVAGDQTWIDDTRYNVFRTWVLDHMIHHRAQLGVYLRLLGAAVPGCYGPSADEM